MFQNYYFFIAIDFHARAIIMRSIRQLAVQRKFRDIETMAAQERIGNSQAIRTSTAFPPTSLEEAPWMRSGAAIAVVCALLAIGLSALLAWHAAPLHARRGESADPLALFHLTLAQLAVVATGSGAWFIDVRRTVIHSRWQSASPRRKATALLLGLVGIELLLVLLFWATRGRSVDELGYLRGLFFFGGEWNLPTLFSSLQLVLLGTLALMCGRRMQGDPKARAIWHFMAAVCVYMAADELLMLHERIDDIAEALGFIAVQEEQRVISFGGWQVRAWTMVLLPLAALLGVALGVGLAGLMPAGSFLLLVAGGALFIAGAVGMENVQAHQMASGIINHGDLRAHINVFSEEVLEMLGVTLAVYALALTLFSASPKRGTVFRYREPARSGNNCGR
jgi:hypothetical protein